MNIPGYKALKEPPARRVIEFVDVVYVYRFFLREPSLVRGEIEADRKKQEAKGETVDKEWEPFEVQVTPHGSIAEAIYKIANNLAIAKEDKLREIARCLLSLLNHLLVKDVVEEPHLDPTARCWLEGEGAGHAIPNKDFLPSGLARKISCRPGQYPLVTLGTRCLEGEDPYPVRIALHRFACWLANGEPGDDMRMATHQCGKKECVALGHLDWGSAQTNRADHLQLANWYPGTQPAVGRKRSRWVDVLVYTL